MSASQTAKSLSLVFSGRGRISQFETFTSRFLSTSETSLLCEFQRKYRPFFVAFYFVFKKDKRSKSEQTHTAILLCSLKCIFVFYCETRDFFKFLCTNFSLGYLRNLYVVCICDY